jgi:hypothetical protein
MKNGPDSAFNRRESNEFGKNVCIVLKIMRHGERDTDAKLTDYGREVTRKRAQESGIKSGEFDMVKAIGSDAGLADGAGARAFETADIYAHEVGNANVGTSRINRTLSYETLKNSAPYDHIAIYNSHLPTNYADLPNDEKSKAAKKAQAATIDHFVNLDTEEAHKYKREIAGSFATVIRHHAKMSKRLHSGSNVLIPAGTHGGTMEVILQQALVRDVHGQSVTGFRSLQEVGGEFDPSEAFNVFIERDESGNLKEYRITFDNPSRNMPTEGLKLDSAKVDELADYYEALHRDDVSELESDSDSLKPQIA